MKSIMIIMKDIALYQCFHLFRIQYPFALVLLQSTASKHSLTMRRRVRTPRLEFVRYDPHVERWVLYKEKMRLKPLLE
ncbi:39S ribosomal protein L33, mitochondrial-like [Centruroides sculpturatus]|uniref:39S ribosomal protein L33, mitochondrial-like n=1 Tax=Centruroides sculpturatus TaxID=218467 RepID=UPI000C6E2FD5|nr:39S ribosomal protein L33, mitochondrial-like [Centruroides sculpturatus]